MSATIMHFTYVDVYHALCTVCLTCHLCDIINKSLTFKHFSKIQLQHTGFQRSRKNMTSGVPPQLFPARSRILFTTNAKL